MVTTVKSRGIFEPPDLARARTTALNDAWIARAPLMLRFGPRKILRALRRRHRSLRSAGLSELCYEPARLLAPASKNLSSDACSARQKISTRSRRVTIALRV